ncbi:hypothetical protein Tco_1545257, partial [Tanacetum coccineum]
GKGPTWLFDLDYVTDSMNYHPVSSENQAKLHVGQQGANQNADYFVLPIWPSYSSTITPALITNDKRDGPREEEQVFMDELERLKRQEKEANEEVEALRKKFEQETENFVIQEGAAKTSSTNIFSTVSSPAKASITDQAKEIQHLKAQIKKLKKQAKHVIHHHRAWLKSVSLKQRLTRKSFPKKQRVHKESVSKQGRKFAKGESLVQRDLLFDELPEDTVDHIETENAQDEGRTRDIVDEDKEIEENVLSTEDVLSTDKDKVSTDKEKVSTDRPIVSTDGSKVSTDRQIKGTDEQNKGTEEHIDGIEKQIESTDEQNEGTEEHIEGIEKQIESTDEQNEGTEEHIEGIEEQIESTDGQRKGTEDHTEGSATQATQTPTSTIFGDDETIAKVLLNMSQAKAVSREKEKGVELKDIEEADRPRPTSTRSLLTLKPLPKIDPKDKGKKK